MMEIPEVNLMLDYWEQLPPVHILVGGYLGMGQKKGTGGGMTSEQLAAMLGATMPPPAASASASSPSLVVPAIVQGPAGGSHG